MRRAEEPIVSREAAVHARPGLPGAGAFDRSPFIVIWETTRACDLACLHCRAEANPQRSGDELTFEEAQALVQSVKAFGTPYPLFILTGGDPAKRPDIFDIISYARAEGLRVAMTPSATPLSPAELTGTACAPIIAAGTPCP